jgi:hypothetical protein
MSKTLGELSAVASLDDNDILLIEQTSIDKNVSITAIKTKMLDLIGTNATSFAAGNHNHTGIYEPLVNPKLSAFNVDFGTTHITVAYGDHLHTGVYEPLIVPHNTAFNVNFGLTHTTAAYGDHNHNSATLTVASILPDMTNAIGTVSIQNIGSSAQNFSNIWAYQVNASTLYVNNAQAISSISGVLTVTNTKDFGITIKTSSALAGSGNGVLNLQSDNIVNVAGSGGVNLVIGSAVPSKNITILNQSSQGQITLNSPGDISLTTSGSINFLASSITSTAGVTLTSGSILVAAGSITSGTSASPSTAGEIVSYGGFSAGGQFRAIGGTFGSMLRNDGTNTYLLTTTSGSPLGTWSALRPFQFNNSTGAVIIDAGGAGTLIGGTVTIGSSGTLQYNQKVPTGTAVLGYNGYLYATKVYNAVWNDIADFIELDEEIDIEYGKVYVYENGKMRLSKSCELGIVGIASDTYGYGLGKKDIKNEIPIAIGGFVLAHSPIYPSGTPLTSSMSGRLSKMKMLDKLFHPERMVATFFREEKKEEWNGVKVNGRHWVKVN